jgi:hypothetical protein
MKSIPRKTFALLIILALFAAACGSRRNTVRWTQLDPENNPPASTQGNTAYRSATGEAVMFGGITDVEWLDETWIWDGENWRLADPANRPPAREKLALAYDEARDRIVLFGGVNSQTLFDDTWEWDGENWALKSPANHPPGRCCHGMAYDGVSERVIVYGGYNNLDGSFLDDTWAWDGTDWVELTCCDTPQMAGHALVNFLELNEIISVMTAGWGTWAWDGDGWHNLDLPGPPDRTDGRAAYDHNQGRAVYFGGSQDGVLLNDTWLFDGAVWHELALENSPAPRFGHSFFYDPGREAFILFGGFGEDYSAETWELKLPEDLSAVLTEPPSDSAE